MKEFVPLILMICTVFIAFGIFDRQLRLNSIREDKESLFLQLEEIGNQSVSELRAAHPENSREEVARLRSLLTTVEDRQKQKTEFHEEMKKQLQERSEDSKDLLPPGWLPVPVQDSRTPTEKYEDTGLKATDWKIPQITADEALGERRFK